MKYRSSVVYVAACVGMAFFGISFIVMGAVLPSLTDRYALDAVGASSLVTFLPVGVLAGSLIFGPLVDRFGYKSLLTGSTLAALAGLEGLAFFNDPSLLRISILFIGLGGGMLNGATNALVSDISDDRNRSSRLSILGVFYGVGALVIPFLLASLLTYHTYQAILKGTGLFMLFCVIGFVVIKFPKPKIKQGFPVKKTFALIKKPLLLTMGFFLFFQSGLEGLINNWVTSYLGETTPIDKSNVILCLTFFVLGMTIARLLLSYLLRLIKHSTILAGGIITAAIGIIVLFYSASFYTAAACLFITGFGLAAGFPVMIGIVGAEYKETSGTAIGIALFIALSGNSILNYAMGHVSNAFGISSFPLFIVILLAIQAIIVLTNRAAINK